MRKFIRFLRDYFGTLKRNATLKDYFSGKVITFLIVLFKEEYK